MENIKRRIQLIIGLILILNVNSFSADYAIHVTIRCTDRVKAEFSNIFFQAGVSKHQFIITRKPGCENYAIKLTTTEDAYGSISVNQETGQCWIIDPRYNFTITADAVPTYSISVALDNGYTITRDPFGRVAVGGDAQFTINRNPEYKNHTIELAVNEPDKCGVISVDQVTGECTIPNVQGDLEVFVKLVAPTPPSVYHTIALTVAPGIWCNYNAGKLAVEDGNHLFLQFRAEDRLLTAADILFRVDGVETEFRTSSDGDVGSYILNPVTQNHSLLIALREYAVTMPEVDGVVTDPAAGEHKQAYGEPFRFTVSLNDLNTLKVYANDAELTPLETGQPQSQQFTIDAVEGPIDIRIEGVNPTGNTSIATTPYHLYVSDGTIVVDSPSDTRLSVFTLSGQLYTTRRITAGTTRIALQAGVYIVRVGEITEKVVVQ